MPQVELLSASQRDDIVRPMLREWLEPLGLVEVAPRRWVNGFRPPVRKLFELDLLKGASLKACWGFSLDFVPHVSGSSVRWHRSNKTARLDVIVDPAALPHPCVLYGADRFRAELRELLPVAVASARRDWEQAATLEDMLQLVRSIRKENTNCFGYFNYTLLPLASAFLNAKTGNLPLAERELGEYLARNSMKESVQARLKQLLRDTSPFDGSSAGL